MWPINSLGKIWLKNRIFFWEKVFVFYWKILILEL
jgi:hypothetical protein